jgi:hypothetical protein
MQLALRAVCPMHDAHLYVKGLEQGKPEEVTYTTKVDQATGWNVFDTNWYVCDLGEKDVADGTVETLPCRQVWRFEVLIGDLGY